jgi:hypothetical protein
MSKKSSQGKKKSSGSSSLSSSNSRSTIEIDPDLIYFTHSRVRPFFTGCNKRIEQTFEEIVNGETKLSDLPLITVIYNEDSYFSLNNRRLFLFKKLKREGKLPGNKIMAQLKMPLEREKSRYIPSRCSLQAKLMREHTPKSGEEKEGEEGNDEDVDDDDEVEEETEDRTKDNTNNAKLSSCDK